jgi:hypothetical protein
MRHLPALALILALPLLAACLPGGDGQGPLAAPVDAIAVTPLDAPAVPEGADVAAPAAEEAAAPPTPPEPQADAAPAVTPAAAPPSPEQLVCERRGGRFMQAGQTGAMACVRTTRDAGQQCRRGSDCEGVCLARSGTCAPLAPLFGCHEILQNDGSRVTQCLD